MGPDIYAKRVVPKLIKSNPPNEIWCGTGAWTVWATETLGLRWLYPIVFSKMYGLNRAAPLEKKLV